MKPKIVSNREEIKMLMQNLCPKCKSETISIESCLLHYLGRNKVAEYLVLRCSECAACFKVPVPAQKKRD